MQRHLLIARLALALAACAHRSPPTPEPPPPPAPPVTAAEPIAPAPRCGLAIYRSRMHGCVLDRRGEPLTGAAVVVTAPDGRSDTTITDETGAWGSDLGSDDVSIAVYYDNVIAHARANVARHAEIDVVVDTLPMR